MDLLTGYTGKDLVINETIYNAFTWIVIGCFGIAGAEKICKKIIINYELLYKRTN